MARGNSLSFGRMMVAIFITSALIIGGIYMVIYRPWMEEPEEPGEKVNLTVEFTTAISEDSPSGDCRVTGPDGSVTTTTLSSGDADITKQFTEGADVSIQFRTAAPESSSYSVYTTPIKDYTVPKGDSQSEATIGPIKVYDVSQSKQTFSVRDQDGNSVSGSADLNTTDESIDITLRSGGINGDDYYGTPEDFTDPLTGYDYVGGWFILIWMDESLDIDASSYDHRFGGGASGYDYYVIHMDSVGYDSDMNDWVDLDGNAVNRPSATFKAANTFDVATSNFKIDIFDTCQALELSDVSVDAAFENGDSDYDPDVVASAIS